MANEGAKSCDALSCGCVSGVGVSEKRLKVAPKARHGRVYFKLA